MDSHLTIANAIVENHAEFKVYQHGLALQQGQILVGEYKIGSDYNYPYNKHLLAQFYGLFDQDELTGVLSFRGGSNMSMTDLILDGVVSLDGEISCVSMHEIEHSYLATCITWKKCDIDDDTTTINITDCTMYRALQETYGYFLAQTLMMLIQLHFR